MKIKFTLKKLLLFSLLLRIFLMFISFYHPDLPNHIDWGIRFWQYGSKVFYEGNFWGVSWPNQPYGSILLFAFISKLKDAVFSFFWFLNTSIPIFPSVLMTILEKSLHVWLVKLPFILSDIALGYLIYKIVRDFSPKHALLATAIYLLNPITIYNSTIWGQTDSLINLLAILGFWLSYKKHFFIGPFIFLSTILFKLSLIIYFPIFFILLFKNIKHIKSWGLSILFFLIFMYLLAIPFTPDRPVIDWIKYMYTNRVLPRQGNMLNGNSFNLWFLIYSFDYAAKDSMPIFHTTAKTIAYSLTIISFIPIYLKLFFTKHAKLKHYFFALLLVAFTSYLFLTNIHERYLYPIFPILPILYILTPKIFKPRLIITLSAIHLLNLYNLWFYPLIAPLKQFLIFDNFIVCRFLSFILFAICLYLYVKYLSEDTHQE